MTVLAWGWLASISFFIWVYLFVGHGGFWRCNQRLRADTPQLKEWPGVVAVVPARNEADVIERAVCGLLDQDYPGPFRVVLVDDSSTDGTGDIAHRAAGAHPRGARLAVVAAKSPPAGWAGKMWAVHNGIREADTLDASAPFLWLTDADIAHEPGQLRALVSKAETKPRDLVSLMVLLRCEGFWERLLIPAFVFFFQMLYPFPRVNNPEAWTAAAAGGCMLVRRAALAKAGGIEAIHDQLIDDCALARLLKRNGPIWLGLTRRSHSLRGYGGLAGVWSMVARSAYDQLHYSPLFLLGTVLAMALVYLVPPAAVLASLWYADWIMVQLGVAAWAMMGAAYSPSLRLYGQRAWWGVLLPLTALLYTLMTVDSARAYYQGRGAYWKGRTQAPR